MLRDGHARRFRTSSKRVNVACRGASRILVTGGAGFIGAACVRRLLARRYPVRVLDLTMPRPLDELPPSELDLRIGDIRDSLVLRQAMDGVSHVLHLAAQVSVARSVVAPVDSASTNIGGFLQVLEAARLAGVQRFVYASSAAVYGNAPTPQREDQVLAPRSPYALEKQVNEQYAALYWQLHGMATLGLRYFNVYGPGQRADSDYAGVIARFVHCRESDSVPIQHGDGQQTRDFVHVTDVAEYSCRALFAEATGVLNIGTGRPCSIADLRGLLGLNDVRRLPARTDDVRHSTACIRIMRAQLGDYSMMSLEQGLAQLKLSTAMAS